MLRIFCVFLLSLAVASASPFERMEALRHSALGEDHSQFESWQAIQFNQAHQPSELKRLGFSWVEFIAGSPPKLRAQFMDARRVVEVVFPVRILFDPQEETAQKTYLVGQGGSVVSATQSLGQAPEGCEVISAVTRYLLSGNQGTKTGVFRSCEGAKIAATFLRIGTLPYAWVNESPLTQPVQELDFRSPSQSEAQSETQDTGQKLPWVAAVFLGAVLVLIAAAGRFRRLRALGLAESIDRYSAAIRQSRQGRALLLSAESQLQASGDQPASVGPVFSHLRESSGERQQSHALVHDFAFHFGRVLRQSQTLSVAFFTYQPETLELDWAASVGNWGIRDAARDSGFALSPVILEEIRKKHTAGEIASLEGYPPMNQWWIETWGGSMGLARGGLLAWVIWPPGEPHPAGALVMRGAPLTATQERGLVLCLREAANAWKTGDGGRTARAFAASPVDHDDQKV